MRTLSLIILSICIFVSAFLFPLTVKAQNFEDKYYKAEVLEIVEEGQKDLGGIINPYQIIKVKILDGDKKGQELTIDNGGKLSITEAQKVRVGEKIIINSFDAGEAGTVYLVRDKYRLDSIFYIVLLFFLIVVAVARFKGVGAILGLIVSLFTILKFIVPQILAGHNPVLVTVAGSFFIMFVTIYLAHGFSRRTTAAVISTLVSLVVAGILSFIFVAWAKLSGLGEEGAYTLQFGPTQIINLKGLLLSGIIIGALGVLDDVTTTQAAAVFELKKVDPKLKFNQLMKGAGAIGKEHVASVVNTLVLAYAGASLTVFIFFILNPAKVPVWVILNGELITGEIVRTLAGSIGLILAVPITNIIASWMAVNLKK